MASCRLLPQCADLVDSARARLSHRRRQGLFRGYRLSAGTELPPLPFDDEQAVALTVALQIAATALGDGLGDAAARALTTVRQVMPSRLRHRVDSLHVTAVEPPARPAATVAGDVPLAISSATQAREILRFDYGSGTTDTPPRHVEPHHVITRDGRGYLVAWDLDRSAWRTFRVDRIRLRIPQRTPLHTQGTARRRRDRLRRRQVPRR